MTGAESLQVNLFELHVNLLWVLDEIDSGTLRATTEQRAALAAAEQAAEKLHRRHW